MLFVITFHVVIMSQLGHKELRFVSYLNPLLNIFAARSAVSLCFQRKQGYRMLGVVIVAGLLAATALVTVISVIASASNYPGGEAMRTLHNTVREQNGERYSNLHTRIALMDLLFSKCAYRCATSNDGGQSLSI
jgi:alpha-1,6-mannosyltransferase